MIDGVNLDKGLLRYLTEGFYDFEAGGFKDRLAEPFVVFGRMTLEVAVYEGAFARLLTVRT